MIHHGSSRLVILIGWLAIKLPHPWGWKRLLRGLLANMQEREFSRLGWPELAPVLFSLPGGFLVVMRRTYDPPPLWRIHDYERWLLAAEQRGKVLPVELKLSSFGLLNGEVVAVDYG